jgi:hypothetical protein
MLVDASLNAARGMDVILHEPAPLWMSKKSRQSEKYVTNVVKFVTNVA